jgi:alpha-glucosidase
MILGSMGQPMSYMEAGVTDAYAWWQRGVIYQVYPRSFQDSDGDGVGDLRGITSRLDYLRWLGVDAIWISPFYPSPMKDFGYDITDHTNVHPMFGDLEDFDALVGEAHHRNIRVIVDYVPNHTSNEHPWFLHSRSSKDDPKRSWYIWRDPAPDGGVPNNWLSVFGGSAWTFDEATHQYYYHAYLEEQPDLNWRNPEVREAMLDVLRFWLERSVDGFRVDALRQLVKDDRFRDNPPNPDYLPGGSPYDALLPVYSTDRPEVHEAIRGMRRVLGEYGEDRVLIGELYLPIERLVRYYGEGGSGVQLPMNFHLISTPWDAEKVGNLIDTYEASLPKSGWPTWVLGNHDRSRIASRVGPAQARVAAMLLLTLRGTPTLYYGDEIGMRDARIPPELVQDPYERNVPGIGVGRDPARTPMQWSQEKNAGFTIGEPWLPVGEDHAEVNVETYKRNPHSMLTLHRRLLALRRAEPALALGSYAQVEATENLLAYARESGGRRYLIALNLGSQPQTLGAAGRVVLSTFLDREGEAIGETLYLRGDEGLILETVGRLGRRS